MNITPLIDVIFILLIFFMISTQFKTNSIPLNLPRSKGVIPEVSNSIVLSLYADGSISLAGTQITRANLTEELKMQKQLKPDLSLTVACDRSLLFEDVIQIFDEVKAAGIEKVGIRHDQVDN